MSRLKGTGWIPDFPDIRDYTLSQLSPQQVVNTVGNETVATSVESLASRMMATFQVLLDAEKNAAAAIALKQIEQEFLSHSLTFRPAQVHQYLNTGTYSKEVLRIKYYLKASLPGLKTFADALSTKTSRLKLETLTVSVGQLVQNLEKVQVDDAWWLKQLADNQFTQLLQLYQISQEIELEKMMTEEAKAEFKLDIPSHKVNGILAPETLVNFEIKPAQKLLSPQFESLRKSVESIDPSDEEVVSETIKRLETPQEVPVFYDLCRLQCPAGSNFNQLRQTLQEIQQTCYDEYLKQTLPQSGIDLIKRYEGLLLQAYQDSVGIWTIGYGHTGTAGGPTVYAGQRISEAQAEQILRQDLLALANQIRALMDENIPYNVNHFGALLSFAFSLGIETLKESTLFKRFNDGNFEAAANEFERWVMAGGIKLPGLQRRRSEEKALFLRGLSEITENARPISYQQQHRDTTRQLLQKFKHDLSSAIAALEPGIQITRMPLSWEVPGEVKARLGEALFTCIRKCFQQLDLPIAITAPPTQDQPSETDATAPFDLRNGETLALYKDEVIELLLPVIQALSECLTPMGQYPEIHRAINQIIDLFNLIFVDSDVDLDRMISPPTASPNWLTVTEAKKPAIAHIRSAIQVSFPAIQALATQRLEPLLKMCQDRFDQLQIAKRVLRDAKEKRDDVQTEHLRDDEIDQDKIKRAQAERDQAQKRYDQAQERHDEIYQYWSQANQQLQQYRRAHQIVSTFIESQQQNLAALQASPTLSRFHLPTLLYIPPLMTVANEEICLFKDYSDSLQMPLNNASRRDIQAFFKHSSPTPSPVSTADQSFSQSATDNERLYLVLPEFVDLSYWCSPVEDQGHLNACTAQAGVAMVEYFAKRTFGQYENLSSRFLYKVARNLMHRTGDTGASLRETMRAMVLFGVPPEEHWPYTDSDVTYDDEPDQFCYAYAQNYQTVKYCRLDYPGISQWALLAQVKAVLVAGLPCMFGLTIYDSIHENLNAQLGHIPLPVSKDEVVGGHAVVAVGYDDRRVIESADGSSQSQGALLIRNSWGRRWGQGGYGWLPYDYVIAGLTADWWTLIKSEWFSSGQFGASVGHSTSSVGTVTGTKDD